MSRISIGFPRSCCLALAVSFCLLGLVRTLCDAQDLTKLGGADYRQLPVDDKLKNSNSEIQRMLRDGVPSGSNEKFEKFFKDYFFPQWTLVKTLPDLPSQRKTLRGYFTGARNTASYDLLLQVSLDNLKMLATSPEYHPGVRFNAAVMLGDLNAKYTSSGGTPDPTPKSLPILLQLLEGENEIDAARFGALLGIVRHAEFSKDEASRTNALDALLRQATQQEVPTKRSFAAHEWFRTTAVEGLAHAKGDHVAKVAPVLAKIVNSSTEPDALRRAAAGSLGKLPLTPTSGADFAVTIRSVVNLASLAVREEIEACEKDQTRTIDPSLLKSRLLPILAAMTGSEKSVSSPEKGLAAAADENEKPFLKKVWKPIDDWYKKLDDKNLVLVEGEAMTPMTPMMGDPQTPARAATVALIEYFKTELQKMDNLLGGGAGTP